MKQVRTASTAIRRTSIARMKHAVGFPYSFLSETDLTGLAWSVLLTFRTAGIDEASTRSARSCSRYTTSETQPGEAVATTLVQRFAAST